MGKVRNKSPAEQPGADAEKRLLSLSICVNGTDAQVASLGAAAQVRNRSLLKFTRGSLSAEIAADAQAAMELLPISTAVAACKNPDPRSSSPGTLRILFAG